MSALLDVNSLQITIRSPEGEAMPVVTDLSFQVCRGEIVGLLGESGCGKSMTALALMGLLPKAASMSGSINLEGLELVGLPEQQFCELRGNRLSMIFQEPQTALNPLQTIGRQIMEPITVHGRARGAEAREWAIELLSKTRLPAPERIVNAYPHELSGGQRQRVVIAMALACRPDLIVADEPTTALDTLVQRDILDLLIELVEGSGAGLVLITHDVGVIAELSHRTVVMYRGRAVETGATATVLDMPGHPYTRGLLAALPQRAVEHRLRLRPIPGQVPPLGTALSGCAFRDRCDQAVDVCAHELPPQHRLSDGHTISCHRALMLLSGDAA